MDKILVPILIAVVSSVITTYVTHFLASLRDSNARHFEQKRHAYEGFFELLHMMIENPKLPEKKLLEHMKKFKKDAFIWASADVLLNFYKFEEDASNPSTVDELFRAIRQDLGHDDSKLKPLDLYKWFLRADERHKIL